MGNESSKKQPYGEDIEIKRINIPLEENQVQDHSVEAQQEVGYIMDMSDTEKEWKEKNNDGGEEKEETKLEKPNENLLSDSLIKSTCKLCNQVWKQSECYSLETCGHAFCFECIKEYLIEKIDVSINDMPKCPKKNCDSPISIGDLKKALETFRAEQENDEKEEQTFDPRVSAIRESVGVFNVSLTNSLELFVESMDFLVKCPSCKNIFEKIPLSLTDPRLKEIVKTDKGKIISGDELQHYLENRFRCRNCTTIFCAQCTTVPYHLGKTCRGYINSLHESKCRYCQEPVSDGSSFYNPEHQNESFVARWKRKRRQKRENTKMDCTIDMTDKVAVNEFIEKKEKENEAAGNFYVCDEEECQNKATLACLDVTPCHHLCGGVKGEHLHLPCLKEGCVGDEDTNTDSYCNICWVEDLGSAPTIELTCGHFFHYSCIKERVDGGFSTPYISFQFANCPLCSVPINHPLLDTSEIRESENIIRALGEVRLDLEGMLGDAELQEGGEYHNHPQEYAILRFAFYQCSLCRKPYFGGKKECGAGGGEDGGADIDRNSLICPSCAGANATCQEHGTDYIEFKCRFCCSLATFCCGGNLAHFCTPCHDVAGEKVDFSDWSTKWDAVAVCPGFNDCPLGTPHIPNGDECCLGCSMCRAVNAPK